MSVRVEQMTGCPFLNVGDVCLVRVVGGGEWWIGGWEAGGAVEASLSL